MERPELVVTLTALIPYLQEHELVPDDLMQKLKQEERYDLPDHRLFKQSH